MIVPESIIICWLPSFLIYLLAFFCKEELYLLPIYLFVCSLRILSICTQIFLFSSVGYNPFLSSLSCSHWPYFFYFKDDFFVVLGRNGNYVHSRGLMCTWFLIAQEKSHLIPSFSFLGSHQPTSRGWDDFIHFKLIFPWAAEWWEQQSFRQRLVWAWGKPR